MRLRNHLAVYLFYLVVMLVITYPLITVIGTRMIGHPFGDAYEYTHHVWWIKTALQTGQNPFFEPNIVYPDGANAVLLWSLPLQSFPAWLFDFVLPLPAAFNLSALLTLALNGWAMFVLARHLVGKHEHAASSPTLPALIAGLAFMLYPAFQGQLGAAHTGLLTLWPAPLYLLMLLRLREVEDTRRTMLAGAVLFMVSLWGSLLLLIYLILPIMAIYGLTILRDKRALRRAAVTVLLGVLFSLPFVVPLALETLHAPREQGAVYYSASLLGIVSPSFYHPLFSGWTYNRQVLGVDPFEQASYVGLIAALIALVGVWKQRQARLWLLLAGIAWVFSLGPLLKIYHAPLLVRLDGYSTHITLPWALFQNLPLLSLARTPARFNFAVGFGVALMVGYGAAVILGSRKIGGRAGTRRQWAVAILLMAAILFDYQFWWPLPTIPGSAPPPIAALAQRNDIRAVFDIPWQHPLANKDGLFLQTGHQHPMIIGQIARRSPINPAKANLLQVSLDPALLDAAGIDVVILHKQFDGSDGSLGTQARQQFGAPFYQDDQFAVFNVPPYHGDPPGFVTAADGSGLYFYAPQAGTARLTGTTGAPLLLDDSPLAAPTAPIHFAAGYHQITPRDDCPTPDDPALRCPPLTVEGLALNDYQAGG